MILVDGYTFKLNKTTAITKYWRCTLHECLSKIHTNLNNQLIKVVGEHDHPLEKHTTRLQKASFRWPRVFSKQDFSLNMHCVYFDLRKNHHHHLYSDY
jgi:hypothetical protein